LTIQQIVVDGLLVALLTVVLVDGAAEREPPFHLSPAVGRGAGDLRGVVMRMQVGRVKGGVGRCERGMV
jgi:hypothetical protein